MSERLCVLLGVLLVALLLMAATGEAIAALLRHVSGGLG